MSFVRKFWWIIPAVVCVLIGGTLLAGKYTGWFDHVAQFYVITGDKAVEDHLYGKAVQQYDFALAFRELDGKSAAQASLRKARVYVSKNRMVDAEAQFLETISLWPSETDARIDLGNFYLNNNQLAKAREQFERAVEKNAKSSDALIGLARSLIADNASGVEIKNYLLRAEQDEVNLAAPYYIALLSMKLGSNVDKAQELLAGIIEKDAESVYAKNARQIIAIIATLKQGELSDTERAYQSVVRAGLYSDLREWSLALAEARQATELLPEYRDAYLVRSQVNLSRGAYDLAKESALNALSIDPLSGYGNYLLGKAYYELGAYDLSRQAFERAVGLQFTSGDVFQMLARLARERTDIMVAKQWYEKAMETPQSNRIDLVQEITLFYIQDLQLPQEATQFIDQALTNMANESRLYSLKAYAAVVAGDVSGVAELVAQAQSINRYDALSEYVLALVARNKKNETLARTHYERSLEYDLVGEITELPY